MSLLADRASVQDKTPFPIHNMASASTTYNISGEVVTFADGAAGTAQYIKLSHDNIMSSHGERIGSDGDSSLAFTTGTILTTQVPWKFKNVNGKDNDTDRLATLADGEFMVDHENGYILGKNATTTSTTTDTVAYTARMAAVSVPSVFSSGQKTVASGGVKAQLGTSQTIKGVMIKAYADNSGDIFVGDVLTCTSALGFILAAGEPCSIAIDNLNKVYYDGTTGDGLSYAIVAE